MQTQKRGEFFQTTAPATHLAETAQGWAPEYEDMYNDLTNWEQQLVERMVNEPKRTQRQLYYDLYKTVHFTAQVIRDLFFSYDDDKTLQATH